MTVKRFRNRRLHFEDFKFLPVPAKCQRSLFGQVVTKIVMPRACIEL